MTIRSRVSTIFPQNICRRTFVALVFVLTMLAVGASKSPSTSHGPFGVPATSVNEVQAQRIVAIGGATTEILYALELEPSIAGVGTTSRHPASALEGEPAQARTRYSPCRPFP